MEELLKMCEANKDQIIQEAKEDDDYVATKVKKREQTHKQIQVKLLKQYKREIYATTKSMKQSQLKTIFDDKMDIVTNLYINPNILLILDDCASIFDKNLQKEKIIRDIFF